MKCRSRLRITAVAWVRSLARELLHVVGAAKKTPPLNIYQILKVLRPLRQSQKLQRGVITVFKGKCVLLCTMTGRVSQYVFYLFIYLFCLFAFSRATPVAYGDSQARGLIGAVAAGLRQSHSNVGSQPHRQPTPQLTATPGP